MGAQDKTDKLIRLSKCPLHLLVKNEKRFWSKVEITGTDECWVWVAALRSDGYGTFRLNLGDGTYPLVGAHQAAFFFAGKNTEGVVRHTCDNRACCNPAHLVGGTQRDNLRDAVERGGVTLGEGHQAAKHSWETVQTIREKYATGAYTYKTLAAETGVPATTIQSYVNGTVRGAA